ncbi:hypothetical protein [Nocardia bovistercoris]|uniref:Secreted protein n=1 Tax=Nocardia bovistercoris TaxID=2785916 RepID=A0A931IEV2_9NOCA|nr:hypothetical protein [Nocardia bovistercoris]MBH0779085.1 hypothetical protein [Nocardia bovistercoris]
MGIRVLSAGFAVTAAAGLTILAGGVAAADHQSEAQLRTQVEAACAAIGGTYPQNYFHVPGQFAGKAGCLMPDGRYVQVNLPDGTECTKDAGFGVWVRGTVRNGECLDA